MDALQIVALLAPNVRPAHRAIVAWLAQETGIPLQFVEHGSWQAQLERLDRGEAHAAFICGLPYTRRAGQFEPLVAPVQQGQAYQGRAVYWSEVLVRQESRFRQVADLRGARLAFNEPGSFSGYLVLLAHLAELGEQRGFFGQALESGSHLASLDRLLRGQADVAAIDSTVLELALRDDPDLAGQLRSVARLGPNPAPPFVASRTLPAEQRTALGSALCAMHLHPKGQSALAIGLIDRFLPATDADYHPIRHLVRRAEGARFI